MGEVYDARDTRLDRAVAIKILRAEFAGSAGPSRALRARGARRRLAESSPHLHPARHRPPGRHRVPRDGTDRRRDAGRPAGARPRFRLARRWRAQGRSLSRAGPCPQPGHRAPRPQARQHHAHQVGREAARLRARTAAGGGGARAREPHAHRTHPGGNDCRHPPGTWRPSSSKASPPTRAPTLFAFGAILYEMVTGRRAFDSPTARRGSSARSCTPRSPSVASTPPAFARVLGGCLARRPEDRWSSAHDVRLLLQGIAAPDSAATAVPVTVVRPTIGRGVWVALAALCAAALVAAGVLVGRRSPPLAATSTNVLSLLPPPGTTLTLVARCPRSRPMGARRPLSPQTRAGKTLLYLRARETGASRAPAGRHGRRDAAVLGARQPAPRVLRARRVEDGGRVAGGIAADPCARTRAAGAARGAKTTSSSSCRIRTGRCSADPRRRRARPRR